MTLPPGSPVSLVCLSLRSDARCCDWMPDAVTLAWGRVSRFSPVSVRAKPTEAASSLRVLGLTLLAASWPFLMLIALNRKNKGPGPRAKSTEAASSLRVLGLTLLAASWPFLMLIALNRKNKGPGPWAKSTEAASFLRALGLTLLAASWLFSCLQLSTGKMKVPGTYPVLRLTWLAWHPVTGVRLPSLRLPSAPFGSLRLPSASAQAQLRSMKSSPARNIHSTRQQERLAKMFSNGEGRVADFAVQRMCLSLLVKRRFASLWRISRALHFVL